MTTVRQILKTKGTDVASVRSTDTVIQALAKMAEHEVGALPVIDDGQLVGMFSERDYARKVALQGKASRDLQVRDIMSEKVYYVTPERTVDECMALMTDKRIRHLPVLDEHSRVGGIVSIGDMVKEKISQQEFIIQQLEAYILR